MPLDGTLDQDEALVILDVAQERIRDPKDWIAFPRALGENGTRFLEGGHDPRARQWCALGAIDYASGDYVSVYGNPTALLLERAAKALGFDFVAQANWDGYDTCHAMFDRARELHMIEIKETVHV